MKRTARSDRHGTRPLRCQTPTPRSAATATDTIPPWTARPSGISCASAAEYRTAIGTQARA